MRKIHIVVKCLIMAICVLSLTNCNNEITVKEKAFSVSTNKKVLFAKGNLQYQASTKTWRFAENQWDYIGDTNHKISDTYSGWIDLFGWGTGKQPTNTSTYYEDYQTYVDWGANIIGTDKPNIWRTLSANEWRYLFCLRPNAKELWGFASVNGINGIIILPDNGTSINIPFVSSVDEGLAEQPIDNETINFKFQFENNIYDFVDYSIADWTQIEQVGAVFLPVTCYRHAKEVDGLNYGYYWSSTPLDDGSAFMLGFNNTIGLVSGSMDGNGRVYAFSVRLVRDL